METQLRRGHCQIKRPWYTGHESARHARLAVAHLVASAKLGAAGAFSTENIKLIEVLVGRAPITTKQFLEDFKALFS